MDYEQLINNLRDKLDDSTKGKVSEELLAVLGQLRGQETTINDNNNTIDKLRKENEELLKTNGRLFQQIGFDKPKETVKVPTDTEEECTLSIDDIIDKKGNLIK
jgi:hypothetical protein